MTVGSAFEDHLDLARGAVQFGELFAGENEQGLVFGEHGGSAE
jgi:hypothetical protein